MFWKRIVGDHLVEKLTVGEEEALEVCAHFGDSQNGDIMNVHKSQMHQG